MHRTPYTDQIRSIAPNRDPRHVEAYMRCEHGTLDRLSESEFCVEVRIAALCVEEGGTDMAERLARSYGL